MIDIEPDDPCHGFAFKRNSIGNWGWLLVLILLSLSSCQPFGVSPEPSPSLPEDLTLAWDVLIFVFDDIHSGRYEAVVKGLGDLPPDLIDTLEAWDPAWQANPDDVAAILEKACTSGFLCLPVRRVVAVEQITENEFEFLVEHALADGSVFVLGPCCGANETEMPPQSTFRYRVIRDDGQWRVKWMPIYVP